MNGLFCANFGTRRRPSLPKCDGVWHPRCFSKAKTDHFPRLQPADLEEGILPPEDLKEVDDDERFQEARLGDHLMCPFQCDTCHFENVFGIPPDKNNQQHSLSLVCIRRAILDSFWARESGTVIQNWRESKRFLEEARVLGIPDPYPPRGPWPVEDSFGMKIAMVFLMRSLHKGKNASTVQFNTVRKVRSHLSNFYHTLPGGMGVSIISSDNTFTAPSFSPTNSLWFRRFMTGAHKRMGDVWRPDRPLMIQEALAAQSLLESDWERCSDVPEAKLATALTAVVIVIGFGAALRGEELVRIEMGPILRYWDEATLHPDTPHVPLVLAGRFKQQVGERIFVQPLAESSASGLQYKTWLLRVLRAWGDLGITDGPIFQKADQAGDRTRVRMGELDPMFHLILRRVQSFRPELIAESVDVEEEYSVSRSIRRGATSQALNNKLPAEVIEANNRWKQRERARGLTPSLSMLQRYADARASIPLLIRFSRNL